jgi:hypothetical protein
MRPQLRTFGAGLAAGLALGASTSAPASAAELLVIDGRRAIVTQDPYLPAGVGGPPPRGASPPKAARTGSSPTASTASVAGRRAVVRALRRARRARRISRARYLAYRRGYRRALSTRGRLGGARRRELSSVIATLESIARRGRLRSSRLFAVFHQLRRNTELFGSGPLPERGAKVRFRGSDVVFTYYAGQGLGFQPLASFARLNGMNGSCEGIFDAPCAPVRLRRLADELLRFDSRRGGFTTWEYYFEFGGGVPPWISGMAQATAMQALARASRLLRRPRYLRAARAAIGAFHRRPPVGVRTRGPYGGLHYLQYSFAPRLYILNAFLQSLLGLYDYERISGDERALRLFRAGDREARRETPAHDTGDWSLYSFRGAESDMGYHLLLRDFLRRLCRRTDAVVYCSTGRRFTSYARDPAEVDFLGPGTGAVNEVVRVRFRLSKRSRVAVRVSRDGRVAYRRVRVRRRGRHAIEFRPRSTGAYAVKIVARELRTGRYLRTTERAAIEVR